MITRIQRIDPELPAEEVLQEAASLILVGELVAFPTETVYGLGANAVNAEAVAKIYLAKGRPSNNPLIVHVPDVESFRLVTPTLSVDARRLLGAFAPGPLTLVLPKLASVPDAVTAGGPTVAVRVPAHPIALALLHRCGTPIAAPSANRSNGLSPTTASHVFTSLSGRVPLILDGGACSGGIESTVVDVTTESPRLLRPGLISAEAIEAVLGKPLMRQQTAESTRGALPSPGMLERHYAPRTAVRLVNTDGKAEFLSEISGGRRVGWMPIGEHETMYTLTTRTIPMPDEPADYARRLYDTLHTLDLEELDLLIVQMPPDLPEWMAIRDRLSRAASPAR